MPARRRSSFPWMLCAALIASLATLTFGAAHVDHTGHAEARPASGQSIGLLIRFVGFWDNYGSYKSRMHSLLTADGTPDWPWIIALIVLCAGVVVGYYRIYIFWRRNYLAEVPADRNRKLMDLAQIFLWCAVCGYAMSIVLFIWPAYRLLAVFLVILNVFTYRFAGNLNALNVSLSAVRLKRELNETLANHAVELERLVEERTRELEQARAAAIAADEAKSDFLANMSHEIRTPMTAILGFTDLLNNPTLDAATRSRHLRTVRESGRHLLAVVNDILDLARIEAGKLRVERINCDVHAVLQEVVALLTPRAAERKLTLSLNIEPGSPHVIQTDPTRLRQVLLNLVGNGIKFTEAGSVAVDFRVHANDPDRVAMAVTDTGVGMDPEKLARLFQRFRHFNSPAQKYTGGSGLGLMISRHLVELLGGELGVQSEADVGSRFTVSLPTGVAHATAKLQASVPTDLPSSTPAISSVAPRLMPLPSPMRESERRRLERAVASERPTFSFPPDAKVLLVDDGDENRQLVQFLLEQQGLEVDIAEDGQAALDCVEAAPDRFDLVLMDIQMPRLDGYAATSTLRSRQFQKPIVALTASTMTGDRERCIAAGCDDSISKPIDSDLLLRTVQRLLSRRQGWSDI